jgi:hypothetical protein
VTWLLIAFLAPIVAAYSAAIAWTVRAVTTQDGGAQK